LLENYIFYISLMYEFSHRLGHKPADLNARGMMMPSRQSPWKSTERAARNRPSRERSLKSMRSLLKGQHCSIWPMSTGVIVWDIETVPDLRGFAAANGHVGKTDDAIRTAMGDKFPKHIYHSIVCIGALVAHRDNGGPGSSMRLARRMSASAPRRG
jgi:hypothetical protein